MPSKKPVIRPAPATKLAAPEFATVPNSAAPNIKELPEFLLGFLLDEVAAMAAHTPKKHRVLLQWALVQSGGILLERERTGDPVGVGDLHEDIRRALVHVVHHMGELWPHLRPHFGQFLITAAALIKDGNMPVGTVKMPARARVAAVAQ